MNDQAIKAETKRRWKKTIFAVVLGAVAGFLSAFGFLNLVDSGTLGELGGSREIAGLVGLVFLVTGLGIGAALLNPKAGAKYLNVEDADEILEQRGVLAYSSAGIAAMGLQLIGAALAAPVGPIGQGMALAIILAMTALLVVTSALAYSKQDELMRAIGNEAGKVAYYLLALFGGGWALAAHLGYVAGPAPLDWITMLYASILLAAFYVTARRGMMLMR